MPSRSPKVTHIKVKATRKEREIAWVCGILAPSTRRSSAGARILASLASLASPQVVSYRCAAYEHLQDGHQGKPAQSSGDSMFVSHHAACYAHRSRVALVVSVRHAHAHEWVVPRYVHGCTTPSLQGCATPAPPHSQAIGWCVCNSVDTVLVSLACVVTRCCASERVTYLRVVYDVE